MTIDRKKQLATETGQTMAEYAVVLTMIIVVTLVAYMSLGNSVATLLNTVRSTLP